LLAQWQVKRAYARHSRTPTLSGYTGAEAAHEILRQAGVGNVHIVEHEELLGDHYDPLRKRLVLSRANYHGTSAAALGIAAECGHAIQHKMAYGPFRLYEFRQSTGVMDSVAWIDDRIAGGPNGIAHHGRGVGHSHGV